MLPACGFSVLRKSLFWSVICTVTVVWSHVARADLDSDEDIKLELLRTPTAIPNNGTKSPDQGKPAGRDKKPAEKDSEKPTANGGSGSKDSSKNGKEPVKFQSTGLTGYREAGTMELEKDVVITQGDTKMEADHVKAFYDPKTKEVVKIVATGNVRITKDDVDPQRKARSTSSEAIFFNKERKVVLKGNPQLIRAGGDIVKGKEITYELDTGWVKVDRVEGVLLPQNDAKPAKATVTKTPSPKKKK